MRILIVDDSIMMRRIISKEFEGADYEVFQAVDGRDALEKIKQFKPDLITLDVDMPVMNGFETAKNIYENPDDYKSATGEKIPIIFITASDTIDGRSKRRIKLKIRCDGFQSSRSRILIAISGPDFS